MLNFKKHIIKGNKKENFEILKNTILIGPNGSGKTSLLKQFSLIKKPIIDNKEVDVIDVLKEEIDVDGIRTDLQKYFKNLKEEELKRLNKDSKEFLDENLNVDLKKSLDEIKKIYDNFKFEPVKEKVLNKDCINLTFKCIKKEFDKPNWTLEEAVFYKKNFLK